MAGEDRFDGFLQPLIERRNHSVQDIGQEEQSMLGFVRDTHIRLRMLLGLPAGRHLLAYPAQRGVFLLWR